MKGLLTTILYQPIWNLLVWLYTTIPGRDFGVAVIALTIVIRLILWPLQQSALKSQKAMQTLQPKLKEIQNKFKDDKVAQNKAMMDLYAAEKVSPFSSCLPLLIQFPFLIALYQALRSGLTKADFSLLYPFVHSPGSINQVAFGFLNLSQKSIPLAILAGIAQFWQTKMLPIAAPPANMGEGSKDERQLAQMNKMMIYTMPAVTVFIGVSLPGGLTLYWLVTTLVSVLQQWIFLRNHKKKQTQIAPVSSAT
jgi:YidC/Oxa1 family membrane protein insertase